MTNNRKIKFRGFHVDENGKEKVYVNGGWVKGYWVISGSILQTSHVLKYLFYKGKVDIHGWKSVLIPTVGQYTGLKDKNGKEIFEEDIVATDFHDKKTYLIKYGIHNYTDVGFYAKDGNYRFPMPDSLKHIIKIGNIYENPELLEVK